jgi:hypothetical protein
MQVAVSTFLSAQVLRQFSGDMGTLSPRWLLTTDFRNCRSRFCCRRQVRNNLMRGPIH